MLTLIPYDPVNSIQNPSYGWIALANLHRFHPNARARLIGLALNRATRVLPTS